LWVTEAVDLRWDQLDFAKGHLHVKRLKGGLDSVHPMQGDELRACVSYGVSKSQSRPLCSRGSATAQ
jgi:hypothetical protein